MCWCGNKRSCYGVARGGVQISFGQGKRSSRRRSCTCKRWNNKRSTRYGGPHARPRPHCTHTHARSCSLSFPLPLHTHTRALVPPLFPPPTAHTRAHALFPSFSPPHYTHTRARSCSLSFPLSLHTRARALLPPLFPPPTDTIFDCWF